MAQHTAIIYSLASKAVDDYWASVLPLLELVVPMAPGGKAERLCVVKERWAIMQGDPVYQQLIRTRDELQQRMWDEARARIAAAKAKRHP